MNPAFIIASSYIGQLGLKAVLAELYARRVRVAPSQTISGSVSILQPILSGDPALGETLESNVTTLPDAPFLWLVDADDSCGITTCETLSAKYPDRSLTIVRCPSPPQGINPKVFKLAAALASVRTALFVVLDDDTRLTAPGLRALIDGLNSGAALATGLPRYHAAEGRYSAWLAEFVNSAAVLTYLPALAFAEPLSIHGMCYAMRTEDARRGDVFHVIERCLTDDLALARHLQREGLRLHQTVQPHDIATSVPSLAALLRILRRWFVFTRLLLDQHPISTRLAVAASYGLPPILLWSLLSLAFFSLTNATALLVTIALRAVLISAVKHRFLGSRVPSLVLVSLLLELAQPALLATAYFRSTIQWRKRTIRVHAMDQFEYI